MIENSTSRVSLLLTSCFLFLSSFSFALSTALSCCTEESVTSLYRELSVDEFAKEKDLCFETLHVFLVTQPRMPIGARLCHIVVVGTCRCAMGWSMMRE